MLDMVERLSFIPSKIRWSKIFLLFLLIILENARISLESCIVKFNGFLLNTSPYANELF